MSATRDLTGKRFGRLLAVEPAGSKNGARMWKCACDCGSIVFKSTESLCTGHVKSCGCLRRDVMSKLLTKDLAGRRFGRLTVIKRSGTSKSHSVVWLCRCDCGNLCEISSTCLIHGHTRSCGCYGIERRTAASVAANKTHGMSKDRLYTVWSSMKQRCGNPNAHEYENYGGRGISVCDEWSSSFEAFCEWAYSHGYDPNAPRGKCTIDRIDVNGNYEPSNCRFVDMKVQCRNRRAKCTEREGTSTSSGARATKSGLSKGSTASVVQT